MHFLIYKLKTNKTVFTNVVECRAGYTYQWDIETTKDYMQTWMLYVLRESGQEFVSWWAEDQKGNIVSPIHTVIKAEFRSKNVVKTAV
jgi:hypothetical protein